VATATRTRDALRSREAILAAAEQLFAERGFERTSLADIGAAAGLSRATPRYFFGSKDELYSAVLQRAFAERGERVREAFGPVAEWASSPGRRSLEEVLGPALEAYVGFLAERPSFVSLVEREALDGGRRLARTPHESQAIEDVLRALRRAARERGLLPFDVPAVLLCIVALGFFPIAHRRTFLPAAGIDPDAPRFVEERARQVLDVVLPMLVAP